MPTAPSEADQISGIEQQLIEKYAGVLAAPTVQRSVEEVARSLAGARIRTYLPVLVHREADDRLRHAVAH